MKDLYECISLFFLYFRLLPMGAAASIPALLLSRTKIDRNKLKIQNSFETLFIVLPTFSLITDRKSNDNLVWA